MLEDGHVADETEPVAPCPCGIQPADGHVETELVASNADGVRRRVDSVRPLEARFSQRMEEAAGGGPDIQHGSVAFDHVRRDERGLVRVPLEVPSRERALLPR